MVGVFGLVVELGSFPVSEEEAAIEQSWVLEFVCEAFSVFLESCRFLTSFLYSKRRHHNLGERMKGKRVFQLCVTIFLMASIVVTAFSGVAYAITGNYEKDNGRHPYVCLVVFDDAPGHPAWRTTGELISRTVVLTAGHGTNGAVAARIWVDENVQGNPDYPKGGPSSYEGLPYTMPGFGYYVNNKGLVGFVNNDVGIVVLSKPVPSSVVSVYGLLPTLRTVDSLPVGTDVTFVGYGVQYQVTPKNNGGPYNAWTGVKERFDASAELLSTDFAINSDFIKCSANAAQGKGGTAFGDSGGPVLLGGTNTILALTSFGANSNCAGVGYYYRIDQADVLSFIHGFVP